jgi:hypothetical protein
LAEVLGIDAAREEMDARGALPLGLVEALAAREDEVHAAEKLLLPLPQLGRRAGEARELVHAVVDGR